MPNSIAQTHNTALKKLLEADITDVRRTAVAYAAEIAVLQRDLKALNDRNAELARRCNEQEQIITRLRA